LGSFGKPSALAGIAGGVAGILIGLYVPLDPKLKNIAVSYGGSALVSGILSGLDMMP
jgi:branched-subunit amino acid ABC-type transport system permease component